MDDKMGGRGRGCKEYGGGPGAIWAVTLFQAGVAWGSTSGRVCE